MAVKDSTQSRERSIADAQGLVPSLPKTLAEEYPGDLERMIRKLNELRSTEICSYLQYKQHAYMVVSLVGPAVKAEFLEHANEELKHAEMLAERIQQLGGVPIYDPAEIAQTASRAHVNVTQGATLEQMVREDLDVEVAQVKAYRALIREVGFDDPTTCRMLEEILKDTEHHAAEMRDLLKTRADTK